MHSTVAVQSSRLQPLSAGGRSTVAVTSSLITNEKKKRWVIDIIIISI